MEHQLGKVAEGPSEKYQLIKREIEKAASLDVIRRRC